MPPSLGRSKCSNQEDDPEVDVVVDGDLRFGSVLTTKARRGKLEVVFKAAEYPDSRGQIELKNTLNRTEGSDRPGGWIYGKNNQIIAQENCNGDRTFLVIPRFLPTRLRSHLAKNFLISFIG